VKIEIPYTEYPFDKDKRLCRVCRHKLRPIQPADYAIQRFMHREALCGPVCLVEMYKANEAHIDILTERLINLQIEPAPDDEWWNTKMADS